MVLLAIMALVGLCGAVTDANACPNCKQLIADSDGPSSVGTDDEQNGGANLAEGYYYSILLMMSVPYVLAAGLGAGLWRYGRRRRPDQAGPA